MPSGLVLEAFPEAGLAPTPDMADAPAAPLRRGVALSSAEPKVLLAVLRPEANLAVWDRGPPYGISAASLAPLLAAAPFTAASGDDTPRAAVAALARQLPAPAPLDLLLDVRNLAEVFAGIASDNGRIRLRLEAVTGRGCHRWHADAVGLRLLCTYRGPGTEWLGLAGGAEAARALGPTARPIGPPARLPTGSAAIFKGEADPGNAGWGCVHRSPPAGPHARARLLLCIDQPGRFSPE